MALQYELAGSQIDGTRGYQEDAFLVTQLTDKEGNPAALVIVADGMGGHAAGNVASNMAVQAFNKHVSSCYPVDNIAEVLRESVHKANNSIKETVAETPALSGMGCTMVVALLQGNKMYWASVGDSHIYLIRNKELIKKNDDHSYGGFLDRMAAAGTPVDQEEGLSRNMLMSAIMGEDINEIDVPEEGFEVQAGDRLLVCSDGMDTLSAGKIIQYSEWSASTKECADALMQAVEDVGMPKQDNTTAVVINITEKDVAAVTAAPPPVEAEPAASDDLDDTAEIVLDSAGSEPEFNPAGEESFVEEEEAEKSNTGMIIGIAAGVIIAIAAGAFFMFGGKEPATNTPSVAVSGSEDTGDGVDIDEEGDEEDETDEVIDAVVEDVTTPAPGVLTTAPVATPPPGNKEFHDTLKDGSPGPTMVRIPAGTFDMGSPGSSRHADERPRHAVKADEFAIGKYEITFADYDKFAKSTGKTPPEDLYMDRNTHPVIFVTWDDAYYYIKWLTEQTGHKYRLPSEAQWEYAAGTGKRSIYWWGFNEEPKRAHCFGCGSGLDPRKPTKIGSFGANGFGLHDTSGNVAEWVHDCWHDSYKDAPTSDEVWEGGDCAYRVARGGAYSSPPPSIRHAKRDKLKSDAAYDHVGIRVVREIN
ncbi:MAG: formylglycine-generating enzyme required for sulfatase activity/serine [Gammaproteobacteria bacterium]|jgi:formylglycine-generating enzyme required for sulfatase activity/serine/threonine protein phosphatase PrpC